MKHLMKGFLCCLLLLSSLPSCAGSASSSSNSTASKAAHAPAYLIDKGAQGIDLSSLISPARRSEAAESALSSVDVLGGAWPMQALEQYSTLDPAQRSAIQVNSLLGTPLPAVMLALPYVPWYGTVGLS